MRLLYYWMTCFMKMQHAHAAQHFERIWRSFHLKGNATDSAAETSKHSHLWSSTLYTGQADMAWI